MARQIAAFEPTAVSAAKTAINRGMDLTLAEGLQLEKHLSGLVQL